MSWYCHDYAKEVYERRCKICGQTHGEQRRKVTKHDRRAIVGIDPAAGRDHAGYADIILQPDGTMKVERVLTVVPKAETDCTN